MYLELENFKAFKKLDEFELKPLTVFCGPNNSGKSTIIQSLLLCKQTLESGKSKQVLLLNSHFTHLGSFRNIIFGQNKSKKVTFNFRFDFKGSEINKLKRQKNLFSMIKWGHESKISRGQHKKIRCELEISFRIMQSENSGLLSHPIMHSFSLEAKSYLATQQFNGSSLKIFLMGDNYQFEGERLKSLSIFDRKVTKKFEEDFASAMIYCRFANFFPFST